MTSSTFAKRTRLAVVLGCTVAALAAPAAQAAPKPIDPSDQPDGWTYAVTHHRTAAVDRTDRLDGWAYGATHHRAPVDQLDGWAYGVTHRSGA
jgi:hypothetical protein